MSPTSFREVRYRPSGAGQKPRVAWVAPRRLGTLRDDLEDAIGQLALFEVVEPATPEPEVSRRHDKVPAGGKIIDGSVPDPSIQPEPAYSDAPMAFGMTFGSTAR
jgi:hypothetical protein